MMRATTTRKQSHPFARGWRVVFYCPNKSKISHPSHLLLLGFICATFSPPKIMRNDLIWEFYLDSYDKPSIALRMTESFDIYYIVVDNRSRYQSLNATVKLHKKVNLIMCSTDSIVTLRDSQNILTPYFQMNSYWNVKRSFIQLVQYWWNSISIVRLLDIQWIAFLTFW